MAPLPAEGGGDSGGRHRAKRSLGQNFLVDQNIQRRIVKALNPGPDDEVLEIGPGMGALTRHLAPLVRRLVLVELDDSLFESLVTEYKGESRVSVVHGDFLDFPLEQLTDRPAELKVIGNIPYNITTPILFSLLERTPRPKSIVIMVQREVADRILAPPGSKTYGALAVGVQSVARAERVLDVGRKSFRPVPDVESSVVRITPLDPSPLSRDEEVALRRLTRAGFGHRRKQFQRILRDNYGLTVEQIGELEARSGFDLQARPETFSPADFIRLSQILSQGVSDGTSEPQHDAGNAT